MYAFVRGRLAEKGLDRAIVETGDGVGFEIFIAESERELFPETGETIQLYTHLYVREDRMNLFGFIKRAARDFFRQLLTQKGIGPSLALSVLSDMGAERFRSAIYNQDIDALKEIKGVGKKTAQRLIVEMAEKLPDPDPVQGPEPLVDETVEALIGLGFHKDEAVDAVNASRREEDYETVEDLLSASLSRLEADSS